jgi:hypothetical protein
MAPRPSIRQLAALFTFAWGALRCEAAFAQIQVCESPGRCSTFASQQDAVRYVKAYATAKQAKNRDIVLHMPIDYRDCILPALLDEMLPLANQNLYVAGMDKKLAAKLAEHGVIALPESAFPEKIRALQNYAQHTSYWHFSFLFTATLKPNEEYEAGIGSACGTLCLSRTRYVLRRVGATCTIVSKHWEGGA